MSWRIVVLRPGEQRAQLGCSFDEEWQARLACTWEWLKDQKLTVAYFYEEERDVKV